jgi:hypothetical protein
MVGDPAPKSYLDGLLLGAMPGTSCLRTGSQKTDSEAREYEITLTESTRVMAGRNGAGREGKQMREWINIHFYNKYGSRLGHSISSWCRTTVLFLNRLMKCW